MEVTLSDAFGGRYKTRNKILSFSFSVSTQTDSTILSRLIDSLIYHLMVFLMYRATHPLPNVAPNKNKKNCTHLLWILLRYLLLSPSTSRWSNYVKLYSTIAIILLANIFLASGFCCLFHTLRLSSGSLFTPNFFCVCIILLAVTDDWRKVAFCTGYVFTDRHPYFFCLFFPLFAVSFRKVRASDSSALMPCKHFRPRIYSPLAVPVYWIIKHFTFQTFPLFSHFSHSSCTASVKPLRFQIQ